jgi:hypothetical protein
MITIASLHLIHRSTVSPMFWQEGFNIALFQWVTVDCDPFLSEVVISSQLSHCKSVLGCQLHEITNMLVGYY